MSRCIVCITVSIVLKFLLSKYRMVVVLLKLINVLSDKLVKICLMKLLETVFIHLICNEANLCNANCNSVHPFHQYLLWYRICLLRYSNKVILSYCFLAIFVNNYARR